MFCINCRKIVTIRKEQGQDYYGDICSTCRRSLVQTVFQSILGRIPRGS